MQTRIIFAGILLVALWVTGQPALAQAPAAKTNEEVLLEIQREMVDLDKQFEMVRQDLFFPKDNEALFYLRNNVKDVSFPVKTIELYINNKKVYTHDYTDSEKIAFNFSGLQPLSRMDVKPGVYQVQARLILVQGKQPIRDYKFSFEKQDSPRFVEVELNYDRKNKDFVMAEKIW